MRSRTKKVLVIGGAGYVGSVLVEELLKRGYAVKVFDRLIYGDRGLEQVRDRIELITGDMRAMHPTVFEDVSAVVNLGGISNDPTAEFNPNANFEMNTVAAEAIAKLAKESGVARYVLASTCSVYDCGVEDLEADTILDETADVHPKAAYSSSKFEAERRVLPMADDGFCPVALRKGTVYGYSPRMRFDLVVNTFLKDALSRGKLTVHFGGEMWRPLVDVRDAARAYIACIEADKDKVKGEIFNLVYRNMRISELALRVSEVLRCHNVETSIAPNYEYEGVRSYRVSGNKIARVLGFRPLLSIEESVIHALGFLRKMDLADLYDPRFYNIRWLQLLEQAEGVLDAPGALFAVPKQKSRPEVVRPLRGSVKTQA